MRTPKWTLIAAHLDRDRPAREPEGLDPAPPLPPPTRESQQVLPPTPGMERHCVSPSKCDVILQDGKNQASSDPRVWEREGCF